MAEQWRPVTDWPEYSISDLGRVRSEHRVILRRNGWPYTVAEKILRPYQHGVGESTSTVALTRPGQCQHRVYIRELMNQWKETR
jgi:hypothetical protein